MGLSKEEESLFQEVFGLVAAIERQEGLQRQQEEAARIEREKRKAIISPVVAKAKEMLALIEPQSNRRWNNQGEYIGSGVFRISPFVEAVVKQRKTEKRLSVFVQDEGKHDRGFVLAAFINCGDPDSEVFSLFEVKNGETWNHLGKEATDVEIDNASEILSTIDSILNPKENKK